MRSENKQADKGLRFVADTMLGRLATWLRILGYDTLYPGQESDHRLARMAADEGRILLTRDRELASRKGFRKLLIQSNFLSEQLVQVVEELGVCVSDPILSRCLLCNKLLQEVNKDLLKGRVPPYVLRTQTMFSECPQCHRVYWPGTHLDHIRRQLQRLSCIPQEENGRGNEPR